MARRDIEAIHVWWDDNTDQWTVSTVNEYGDEISAVAGYDDLSDAWESGIEEADRYHVPALHLDRYTAQEVDRYEPDEDTEENPRGCGRGEIKVQRKGYKKHAYTTKKGTHVSATRVPPTTFCAEDRGKPGRTSRGAKAGPHSGEAKWIQRKGKLGGAGYTEKSAASRHKILDACVKKYGYRSCLGSIMVLERDSEISSKAKAALKADRAYLERKYGGPGSFGPRKNPEMSVPDVLALYRGAPGSAASQTAQIKRKLMS